MHRGRRNGSRGPWQRPCRMQPSSQTGRGGPVGEIAMAASLRVGAIALGVAAISLAPVLAAAPSEARPARYSRERAEAPDVKPARLPEGPINIVISIGSQRLWVYDKRGLLETSIV